MAQTVDIYINATTCGDFNVKLKPSAAINSTLTNIQFTVKWPESSPNTNLINAVSSYVGQQGTTTQYNSFNYATFVGIDVNVNWAANTEYEILTFSHDQAGGTATGDFGSCRITMDLKPLRMYSMLSSWVQILQVQSLVPYITMPME